ncbi:MAG: hypothetical protein KGR16_05430 [Verrucomicrobia bacterium]|nr:hypothetical protein [Verrucomicrobiota bacterium]MDE3047096.1 hypothetical protein [Verrucomicrobiota bacterium]
MDLYCKMGEALRDLFKDLFRPEAKQMTQAKMRAILKTAQQIGGSLAEEAQRLHSDIERYFKHPQDPKILAILKKHAMHLEQETREI